jgi:hypothetical protein
MSNVTLTDLWLNKHYRGMVLGETDISYAHRVTVQNCESHGVVASYGTGGVCQWQLTELLSQLNLGDGFNCVNATATSGIGPWFTNCSSFHNALTGYYVQGDASHLLNDVFLLRCIASSDVSCGIHFNDVYGKLHLLHHPWVELVGMLGNLPQGYDGTLSVAPEEGHGIRLTGTLSSGAINVVGGMLWSNAWAGLELGITSGHVNGMTFLDNGAAEDANLTRRCGISLNASAAQVSGCTFLKSAGIANQSKGITLSGTISVPAIDASNYFGGYDVDEFVDMSLATLSGATPVRHPFGLQILTGQMPMSITNELGGGTPTKFIRSASGRLEILDSAATNLLMAIDESAVAGDTSLIVWDVTAGAPKRIRLVAAGALTSEKVLVMDA